jgi:hypothetical protein
LLLACVKSEADVINRPFLTLEDPIRKSLLAMDNGCLRNGTANKNVFWHIDAADSFDEQLNALGKSTRGTLRNKLNRFRGDVVEAFSESIRSWRSSVASEDLMTFSRVFG